jgi:hypothetical protein
MSLDIEINVVSDTSGDEKKLSIDKSHDRGRLTVTLAEDIDDWMSREENR